MTRKSTAVWNGSGKEGNGRISSQSGVLSNTQYSYKSRFEQGIGTNPEELIAAAHAGCFTMKLSFSIGEAGFTPRLSRNHRRSNAGKWFYHQIAPYFKRQSTRHERRKI